MLTDHTHQAWHPSGGYFCASLFYHIYEEFHELMKNYSINFYDSGEKREMKRIASPLNTNHE